MTYRLMSQRDDADIPGILSVYKLPSIARFVSIDEANYWSYVTATDNVYFYKVFEGDTLIATIHMEWFDRTLSMAIVVFPAYQRKGVATSIVKDIQEGKLGPPFDQMLISIDENNTASLRLFEKAGFQCVARDEGLLEYAYTKR